jgi:hypothetical protein
VALSFALLFSFLFFVLWLKIAIAIAIAIAIPIHYFEVRMKTNKLIEPWSTLKKQNRSKSKIEMIMFCLSKEKPINNVLIVRAV